MTSGTRSAAQVHGEAIIIDGCSFFCQGWSDHLAKAGVTALQMTVPWPNDDARQAIRRYEEYYRLVQREPRLAIVLTTDDIRRVKQAERVGFILGSQNARMLEDDPGLVEVFHKLGVRVIQLSYNERNLLADGCVEPSNAGLSRLGKTIVKEMNRVGIQVDLTHVGERSSLDALEAATKPCIFSHSNPRARADNPRNLTDQQIRLCAEQGGVIGVSSWAPICWTGGAKPPDLDDLIGHIDYVVSLVGIDHVSIGTDSEATPGAYPVALHASLATDYPETQTGLKAVHPDVRKTQGFAGMEDFLPLTAALLDRGWQETDVRKFLGENLLRVYRANWGA